MIRQTFALLALLAVVTGCRSKEPARTDSSVSETTSPVAGAEDSYISARDAYRRALAAGRPPEEPDSVLTAQDRAAVLDLEKRLRPIVGPFQANGFAGPGKMNLVTLIPGSEESGALDGIVYSSADSATHVLVTTRTVLTAWLRDNTRNEKPPPPDAAAALSLPYVYTQAFQVGAAVVRYADIPIPGAAKTGVITAMLIDHAQDVGASTPKEIVVGLTRGERVLILGTRARVQIAPMPECLAIRDLARKEEKTEDEVEAAFHRCYAERAPRAPAFSQLIAQVSEIVAQLEPQ